MAARLGAVRDRVPATADLGAAPFVVVPSKAILPRAPAAQPEPGGTIEETQGGEIPVVREVTGKGSLVVGWLGGPIEGASRVGHPQMTLTATIARHHARMGAGTAATRIG